MGRRQAVRHGSLDPAFGGSNPPAPATDSSEFPLTGSSQRGVVSMGCVQSIGKEVNLYGTHGSDESSGRLRSCGASRGCGGGGLLERAEELVNGDQERCRWHRTAAESPCSQFLKRNQRRRWRRRLLRGHQEVASAVCTGRDVVRSTRKMVESGHSGPANKGSHERAEWLPVRNFLRCFCRLTEEAVQSRVLLR